MITFIHKYCNINIWYILWILIQNKYAYNRKTSMKSGYPGISGLLIQNTAVQ
jgi:hypothetical protein